MTEPHVAVPESEGGSEQHTVGRRRLLGWLFGAFAAGSIAQACDVSGPAVVSSRNNDTTSAPPGATTSGSATSSTSGPSPTPAVEPADNSTTEPALTDTTLPADPPDTSTGGIYERGVLYVALYGFPGDARLGVLGEQDALAGAQRAIEAATAYTGFGRRVVPAFEILASIASATAGDDGDYSNEFAPDHFRAHLDAASANGLHVVFDLQPGRSRFPDQARRYEALWLEPHASIALDPEWRVGPDEQPGGGEIGTVDADEVNETIAYIDGLITAHGLPPKMCIVHQFDPTMITDKQLIQGTDHVQVVLQMDGFGPLDVKRGSWERMLEDLPTGAFTGWKNFYDEDQPTPTAAETMANKPQPHYVSFQ